MAKSKKHTTHNQSCKWHRNGIKKPKSQRFESLKGVDRRFVRKMRFAKKHKKSLQKMPVNNAKAVSACTDAIEALVKPMAVQSQDAKGPQPQTQHLAFITHRKLRKQIQSYMAKGRRLCQPKPKAEAAAPA
ncbi:60S ribosomal protein L29-like [Mus caroli]|uniref:60S ribosomal protein L29 n=1 Tax=Mus caroli TaxID=10089 RepID=A0A6P5QHK0_MUSCR|nr:60S ribosomal protein L29-like [Mus caroli]